MHSIEKKKITFCIIESILHNNWGNGPLWVFFSMMPFFCVRDLLIWKKCSFTKLYIQVSRLFHLFLLCLLKLTVKTDEPNQPTYYKKNPIVCLWNVELLGSCPIMVEIQSQKTHIFQIKRFLRSLTLDHYFSEHH